MVKILYNFFLKICHATNIKDKCLVEACQTRRPSHAALKFYYSIILTMNVHDVPFEEYLYLRTDFFPDEAHKK